MECAAPPRGLGTGHQCWDSTATCPLALGCPPLSQKLGVVVRPADLGIMGEAIHVGWVKNFAFWPRGPRGAAEICFAGKVCLGSQNQGGEQC